MGFLSFLTGKSPEQIIQKADDYSARQEYGLAKIEYEKARDKIEKQSAHDPEQIKQITEKITECRERLADEHLTNARELIESDCYPDAEELLKLALELTTDAQRAETIRGLLKQADRRHAPLESDAAGPDDDEPWEPDEYFSALTGSFPEEKLEAYLSYGEAFQAGYVALNQGDFQTAVQELSRAMEQPGAEQTYIPLELATALLNQGRAGQAEALLIQFAEHFPASIRAYQLRCEILWERGQYDEAETLLKSCPPEIAQARPMQLLVGETYFLAGSVEKANQFYRKALSTGAWDAIIAQSLAGTYEALNQFEDARELYGQIIGSCQSCGSRVPPEVKQRYAETTFHMGDTSPKLLELYFTLSQEDAENQPLYYQRIAEIYDRQGNGKEAARFRRMTE